MLGMAEVPDGRRPRFRMPRGGEGFLRLDATPAAWNNNGRREGWPSIVRALGRPRGSPTGLGPDKKRQMEGRRRGQRQSLPPLREKSWQLCERPNGGCHWLPPPTAISRPSINRLASRLPHRPRPVSRPKLGLAYLMAIGADASDRGNGGPVGLHPFRALLGTTTLRRGLSRPPPGSGG